MKERAAFHSSFILLPSALLLSCLSCPSCLNLLQIETLPALTALDIRAVYMFESASLMLREKRGPLNPSFPGRTRSKE
jgi:hypothetical protein